MIASLLLAACASPTSSAICFLGAGSNVWFPIIIIVTMVIIAIVSIIYQLSPLLGRNDIQVWARAKIYDCFITIIFAIIFLSFSTAILTINPVSSLSYVGLVPKVCYPSASSGFSSNIADIYGISECDISTFNSGASSFTESLFILGIIGGINPSATVILPFGAAISPATGAGLGVSFQFQALPIVLVHQYIVPYMQAYFLALLVSQLLQLLLNSAPLLFSIFMILGLVARSFSITKSFGGAMIAFGLGLGFVYPLMASITYGFLDATIQNTQIAGGAGYPSLFNLAPTLFLGLLSLPLNQVFNGSFSFLTDFTPLILYGGFVAVGLMMIPLLNLIVVDAFIVDFSKAIGERMDLFSLLTRML